MLIQEAKSLLEQRVCGGGSRRRLKTSPPHIFYFASDANSLRPQRSRCYLESQRAAPYLPRGSAVQTVVPQNQDVPIQEPTSRLKGWQLF